MKTYFQRITKCVAAQAQNWIMLAVLVVFLARNNHVMSVQTEAIRQKNQLASVLQAETLLEKDLITIESAERGYTLTGDRQFLEVYEARLDFVEPDENILIQTMQAAGLGTEQFPKINELIVERLKELQETVDIRAANEGEQGLLLAAAVVKRHAQYRHGAMILRELGGIRREAEARE